MGTKPGSEKESSIGPFEEIKDLAGSKKALRQSVFRLREQEGEESIAKKSRAIYEHLLATPLYRESHQVLVYVSCNREVQTRQLIKRCWEDGKQVAVPKVVQRRMEFYSLTDFSQLGEGYYGILEPRGGSPVQWENALMVMPGVAFDRDHHRIGYGGGYYDRYLEEHPSHCTLALSFEFQVFDQVPWEETDIRPQYLVTEKGVFVPGGALAFSEA